MPSVLTCVVSEVTCKVRNGRSASVCPRCKSRNCEASDGHMLSIVEDRSLQGLARNRRSALQFLATKVNDQL